MNTKVFLLLAMAALAAADFSYGRPDSHSFESYESYESDEFTRPKYDFQWHVRDDSSGNNYGQKEARDGDHTQGVYTVRLPDGRLQTVTYRVDGREGYVADVKYEGKARYPHYSSESYESGSFESFESREYRPPRPVYYYGSNESK